MSEKKLSPEQETLTKMGAYAIRTRCNCKICMQLRDMVFSEMRNTIYTLRGVENTDCAITDLDTNAVLGPAQKKTKESQEDA